MNTVFNMLQIGILILKTRLEPYSGNDHSALEEKLFLWVSIVQKVETFNLKTRKHLRKTFKKLSPVFFLGSDRQLISTANLEGESAGDYPDQGSTIPCISLHSHQ